MLRFVALQAELDGTAIDDIAELVEELGARFRPVAVKGDRASLVAEAFATDCGVVALEIERSPAAAYAIVNGGEPAPLPCERSLTLRVRASGAGDGIDEQAAQVAALVRERLGVDLRPAVRLAGHARPVRRQHVPTPPLGRIRAGVGERGAVAAGGRA
jgi:hypothetical protein